MTDAGRHARLALGLIAVALAATLLAPHSRAVEWPLGLYEHQPAEKIAVTRGGAQCGDGTPFSFLFSASRNDPDTNRVVIWLPGGSSTRHDPQGELKAPTLTNLARIRNLLSDDDGIVGMRSYLFMDHPANDSFIGDAHWVKLPYCTQDFHSGNLSEPKSYDFTRVVSLQADICGRVGGTVDRSSRRCLGPLTRSRVAEAIDRITARRPTLEIDWRLDDRGDFVIDRITLSIAHQGARNIAAAYPLIRAELRDQGVNLSRAEVVIAGSSAGGFGALYNAFRVGDDLYERPGHAAKLTIVPMAGGPTTRRWDDEVRGLVEDPRQLAGVEDRLGYYDATVPCDFDGGEYVRGASADRCYDALELVDHYRRRYRKLDLRIVPVVNKEDGVAVNGSAGRLGQSGYGDRLLELCQTIHAYGEQLAERDGVDPWVAWLWQRTGANEGRVHGPSKYATMLVPQVAPSGSPGGGSSDGLSGALAYVNAVADRDPRVDRLPIMVDHRLALIENVFDPRSGLDETYAGHWDDVGIPEQACNVEPPPSSRFVFTKVKKNKGRGRALLVVRVPGPGKVRLAKTRKLRPQRKRAAARGPVRLRIKPRREARRRLNKRGRIRAGARVTFVPEGGTASRRLKRLRLVKH